MPNHITSRITVNGPAEAIEKFFAFIKADTPDCHGEYSAIDFNKIIPMPEALDVPSSSEGENGMKWILGHGEDILKRSEYMTTSDYKRMVEIKETNPERFEKCLAEGRQYLRNLADYGYTTWYGWRIANWGSKWNAYETSRDDNSVVFQTAWNGVPNLVAELAKRFPELELEYKYADEDTSYNVGHFIMQGENIEDLSPEDASPEAWALVFDLGVADEDEYVRQPDGTYKYCDEEDE